MYDFEVVTHLINRTGFGEKETQAKKSKESCAQWVGVDKLQEGMVLMGDLRLKDGRLLLVNGTVLKKTAIGTIQRLGERQLINDYVFISN